ncbi:hypothetical protein AB6A40_010204 [Gnathostoma spinigerum]|uniref:Uncharacterized protein n=1 Tax=Gnathostoma spinigerum TaxID=75299 RepID=A0ABD6EU47_9BILA
MLHITEAYKDEQCRLLTGVRHRVLDLIAFVGSGENKESIKTTCERFSVRGINARLPRMPATISRSVQTENLKFAASTGTEGSYVNIMGKVLMEANSEKTSMEGDVTAVRGARRISHGVLARMRPEVKKRSISSQSSNQNHIHQTSESLTCTRLSMPSSLNRCSKDQSTFIVEGACDSTARSTETYSKKMAEMSDKSMRRSSLSSDRDILCAPQIQVEALKARVRKDLAIARFYEVRIRQPSKRVLSDELECQPAITEVHSQTGRDRIRSPNVRTAKATDERKRTYMDNDETLSDTESMWTAASSLTTLQQADSRGGAEHRTQGIIRNYFGNSIMRSVSDAALIETNRWNSIQVNGSHWTHKTTKNIVNNEERSVISTAAKLQQHPEMLLTVRTKESTSPSQVHRSAGDQPPKTCRRMSQDTSVRTDECNRESSFVVSHGAGNDTDSASTPSESVDESLVMTVESDSSDNRIPLRLDEKLNCPPNSSENSKKVPIKKR